ncbi:nucleotide exchange factor GrpE [Phenylobacterium sp.]|jgi:molecular chaperone GrpE|uniref:nucleotide exchange factor GrpE n=1 Tax=Phenylobacterium sp. TaxID=1871053 RepID=UPI0025F6D91D|nr:nucleotide exchange factor GrpE [Phenylobacterium sp.]MCA3745674.1 nucleotide exchange factor GrpE [Phenylobacterium sp.]
MSDHPQSPDETPSATDPGVDAADSLAALAAENAALKEQILRYAADAENVRRRAERETNDARAYAIQKFARDLLGVADTLGRALSAPPASEDAGVRNFVVGVEMTQKALLSAFESNGLKTVTPAMGDRFDPHLHQAMMEQDSPDLAPGGVIQCLQPGYELLGRLVRPAMVVVASRTSGGATPEGEAPGAHLDTRA